MKETKDFIFSFLVVVCERANSLISQIPIGLTVWKTLSYFGSLFFSIRLYFLFYHAIIFSFSLGYSPNFIILIFFKLVESILFIYLFFTRYLPIIFSQQVGYCKCLIFGFL